MSVLRQDLDVQRHVSWILCSVSSVDTRGDFTFCWYCWNWWQSLFKLSFHFTTLSMYYIWYKNMNICDGKNVGFFFYIGYNKEFYIANINLCHEMHIFTIYVFQCPKNFNRHVFQEIKRIKIINVFFFVSSFIPLVFNVKSLYI